MTSITTHQLDNGLQIVFEPIASASSVAVNWLLPAGSASDSAEGEGHATLLSEMIFRGAGDLDSRAHSDAMDRYGVQRSADVLTNHLQLRATMLGSRLNDALPLVVDMVRRPHLPADKLDAGRSLCLQSLAGIDDEPQQLVMLQLKHQHHPTPFNRHGYGTVEVLTNADIEDVRRAWRQRFVPDGSILCFAGSVDPDATMKRINDLLGDWSGSIDEPQEIAPADRGVTQLKRDTSQVHIGMAWDAPPEPDESSMLERMAVSVLSGGTSGRLFTEVRQKRSLCYSIGASYHAGRDRGLITLYTGTTPDRAQETIDVCYEQLDAMREGITQDEFDRAATGLKSRLIMQGESTAARAGSLGQDLYRIGRPRSLDEVAEAIDAVTLDDLSAYLAERSFGTATVAAIGEADLTLHTPSAV